MRERRINPFSRLRNDRGQALAEFSMVLMLLLIVLFGVIEVGRFMFTYVTLADGARAGARYAIVHGSYSSGPSGYGVNIAAVQTQVTNITAAAGLTIPAPDVEYSNNTGGSGADPAGNLTGDPVTVTVSYGYVPLTMLAPLTSLQITLTSTSKGIVCY